MMTGVEIHAQAYETISRGVSDAGLAHSVAAVCLLFTIGAGMYFCFSERLDRLFGRIQRCLLSRTLTPHVAFAQGSIFPYLAPVWAAWLSVFAAAAWQYFVVRQAIAQIGIRQGAVSAGDPFRDARNAFAA